MVLNFVFATRDAERIEQRLDPVIEVTGMSDYRSRLVVHQHVHIDGTCEAEIRASERDKIQPLDLNRSSKGHCSRAALA
jgi:hypothetical protein